MTPSGARSKTSGLAITSFVLGFLSCLFFPMGVPAIITGHVARGRIRRSEGTLEGGGVAMVGLSLGYLSIFLVMLFAFVAPAVRSAWKSRQLEPQFSNGRQIVLAVKAMAADGSAAGDKARGFPADAGMATVAELKERLIKGHYLSAEQVEKLGFDNYLIGNVSESDPENTVLVRSRSEMVIDGTVVFMRKDGAGFSGRSHLPRDVVDPPRTPAYLAP